MSFFERHVTCPGPGRPGPCLTPGPYYTLFGSEIRALRGHLLGGLLVGFALSLILMRVSRLDRGRVRMICFAVGIVCFLLFAYLRPVVADY
jgi:hypothetical protein